MNSQQLIENEIENYPELPVFPLGIPDLLQILTNDDINYAQIADELEKFPSITIKVVATANSAWASPAIPITSLRDSCSRIGLMLVRSISISLSISQVFDSTKCPSFDPKTFWVSALLTAEAAYLCADNAADVCPDTARLAGLLHNIGLLWMADKKPIETTMAITTSQKSENRTLAQVFLEDFNFDLNAISGYLTSAIELPDVINLTIASNPENNSNDSNEPMVVNHHYACELASFVLLHSNFDNKEASKFENDPSFNSLVKKLPKILIMAQMLFPS